MGDSNIDIDVRYFLVFLDVIILWKKISSLDNYFVLHIWSSFLVLALHYYSTNFDTALQKLWCEKNVGEETEYQHSGRKSRKHTVLM